MGEQHRFANEDLRLATEVLPFPNPVTPPQNSMREGKPCFVCLLVEVGLRALYMAWYQATAPNFNFTLEKRTEPCQMIA